MALETTPYIVRPGDYLAKIAFIKGFDPDAVWNDAKNEELRSLRQDPNILSPGDILHVPEGNKNALCLQHATDNDYAAAIPKVQIQIHLRDDDGPFAGETYQVQDLGEPISGTTDGDGGMTVDVPVTVTVFHVLFPVRNVIYPVLVGHMDPIHVPSGARERLRHLGYRCNPSRAEAPESSEEAQAALDRLAIQTFQRDHRISPTGEMDEATRSALVNAHGS